MIVPEIIHALATSIAQLGYISQAGGMVQEVTRGGKIDVEALVYPFTGGKPVRVSPEARESGITFFQVGPTRSVRQDRFLTQWENELTLTGWLNGNRLDDVNLAEFGVYSAISGLRVSIPQGSPVRALDIEFAGNNEGQEIGSRWGWTAPEFQYGKAPYRLFQHRYRLTYFVSAGCLPSGVSVLKPAC